MAWFDWFNFFVFMDKVFTQDGALTYCVERKISLVVEIILFLFVLWFIKFIVKTLIKAAFN